MLVQRRDHVLLISCYLPALVVLLLPMSEPSRMFQGLNLDDMPVTRSGLRTSQEPQRGTMSPSPRGRGRGRVQSLLPPVDLTRAYSGVEYDTDIFSPTSAQRARKGLQSEMVVDQVQRHGSGSDRYYAFQISKPVVVHIHDPAGSSDRIIECTCDKYKDTETPCKHIWWLFAGLHKILIVGEATAAPRPTQPVLTTLFRQIYPLIPDERLDVLPRELNLVGVDDPGNADADLDERKNTVCDILAGFYNRPTKTPEELKDEFGEDLSHLPLSEVLVEGNLQATVYRLAMRDNGFYKRLQEIVPNDMRAKQYYEILYLRAQEAMERLTTYATNGPLSPRDLTVPGCARVLRSLVHQMCQNKDARNAIVPLGTVVASRLAVILVRLIDRVIDFNQDVYANARWNRTQPSNEHPRDRNLFAYLIGDPPSAWAPDWKTDYFVIDRLRRFPVNEWEHLTERLDTIRWQIEKLDTASFPMASRYARQIDEMLGNSTATTQIDAMLRDPTAPRFETSPPHS